MPTYRVLISLHPLFSTYSLLGAHLHPLTPTYFNAMSTSNILKHWCKLIREQGHTQNLIPTYVSRWELIGIGVFTFIVLSLVKTLTS